MSKDSANASPATAAVTAHTATNAPVVISSSALSSPLSLAFFVFADVGGAGGGAGFFWGGVVVDVVAGAGDGVGFSGLNTSTGAGRSGFGSGSAGRSTTSIGAVTSPRFSGTYR